jgi:hypothetical protein
MAESQSLGTKSQTTSAGWKVRLFNIAGFQIGWFACVLGAAADNPWVGPLFVGFLALLHLMLLPEKREQIRFLFFAALLGTGLDGLLILINIFAFTGSALPGWLSPLWLTAMWVNFALTLRVSLSWLLGRYWLGAALGAAGGPAAYYTGARLGAIEFQTSLPLSFLILAVVWSGALPLMLYWARKEP